MASDADLVRRIGSGHDSEAEGELCRRMAPRVRLHGLRHLRDPHAADDLMQQVLMTAREALRAGRAELFEQAFPTVGAPAASPVHGDAIMSCSGLIDAAVLADYWRGLLTGAEEESVEEHLLECDACGVRLREVIELTDGVQRLARGGVVQMVVSDAFLRRAAEDGLRIREYSVAPGGPLALRRTWRRASEMSGHSRRGRRGQRRLAAVHGLLEGIALDDIGRAPAR